MGERYSLSLWVLVDGWGANTPVSLSNINALELLHISDASWDHEPWLHWAQKELLSLLRETLSLFKLFQIRYFSIILIPFFLMFVNRKIIDFYVWILYLKIYLNFIRHLYLIQSNLGFSKYTFTSVISNKNNNFFCHFHMSNIFLLSSYNGRCLQNDIIIMVIVATFVLEFSWECF